MIVYNVTVKIENAITQEWMDWMQSVHIPEVMATDCFLENKMMRLLDPPADEQGTTFAVQYFCRDLETLRHYWKEHAPALQASHAQRYKDKFVAFRTVLEIV